MAPDDPHTLVQPPSLECGLDHWLTVYEKNVTPKIIKRLPSCSL